MTATPTPTPTATPLLCGSGTTTGNFYYYDCCGYFITGTTVGLLVSLDYTKPHNGIFLFNVPATTVCPTPTPTYTPTLTSSQTPTPTSTSTPTPTLTPTFTPTVSLTPTSTGFYALKNECEVFTLFDLGVECFVVNQPTTDTSLDGILTLKITGGTSPYNITWEDGQKLQTLSGIKQGSYEVIVIDYYGDYSARTTCNIFAPTPTPTPTTTSTPTPTLTATYTCTQLCMFFGTTLWQFICNGEFAGRLKWTYNNQYNIVWNSELSRWEIRDNSNVIVQFANGTMISTSQSTIPTDSWAWGGGIGPIISVIEGECPPIPPLIYTISKVDDLCENDNNPTGSINILANGGVPPLSYSIYNGVPGSFQSSGVFNGLPPATYSVVIKDSVDTTFTSSVVISSTTVNETYNVSLEIESVVTNNLTNYGSQFVQYRINIEPPLPTGYTMNVNLNVDYLVANKGPWFNDLSGSTATFDINPLLYRNNVNISDLYSQIPNELTEQVRSDCPAFFQVNTNGEFSASITINANENIVGVVNTFLTITNPVSSNGCTSAISSIINVSLDNLSISGCNCCTAVNSGVSIVEVMNVNGVIV